MTEYLYTQKAIDELDQQLSEKDALLKKLMSEFCELAAENKDAIAEIDKCKIAMHDAINSPKGVVPKSADGLYDQGFYDEGVK